jgi:hypothetical protein
MRNAAQPGAEADVSFGLVFSLVYSSVIRCILGPSLAQPDRRLTRQPLGR